MAVRVQVRPRLWAWAQERSKADRDNLIRRFPKLDAWERGEAQPTLKQLEAFARATSTPVGFLLLPEPPEERVPIPDYRTIADRGVGRPSADLLDTIFQCEQRQEWYRDYAQVSGEEPIGIVGSMTTATPVIEAAATTRQALEFTMDARAATWGETFTCLRERAEDLGVLVMTNGVVGSNTHRKLDPEEFRGFALIDDYAPLVFVNGADTKAAQIFTLAHELAHVWLGEAALSDATIDSEPAGRVERWCNEVAAELLVPAAELEVAFEERQPLTGELERLARHFKVSTLVVLRRLHDTGHIDRQTYRTAYRDELARVLNCLTVELLTGRRRSSGVLDLGVGIGDAETEREKMLSALEGEPPRASAQLARQTRP